MARPGYKPEPRRAVARKEGLSRLRTRRRRAVDRQWKVHDPKWVDPVPWVYGTFPEKLVFAWLWQRGIPFEYQQQFPDCPDTIAVEEFRPDFMAKQFKIIIEVQGEYFHTLPGAAEHDALKFAIYKHMGWEVYWFWESDILTDLAALMESIKEFRGYTDLRPYERVVVREDQIDDLKALRAANSNSRRPPAPVLAARTGRKRR